MVPPKFNSGSAHRAARRIPGRAHHGRCRRRFARVSPVWWLNLAIAGAALALYRDGRSGPPGPDRAPPAVVGPGDRLPRGRELRGPPAVPAQRPLLLARRPPARVRPAVRDRGRPRAGGADRVRGDARDRAPAGAGEARLQPRPSSRSRPPSRRWSSTWWPPTAPRSTRHLGRRAARHAGERRDHGDADRRRDLPLGGRAAPQHDRPDARAWTSS